MPFRRGFSQRGPLASRSQRRKTAWSIGPGGTGAGPIASSSAAFVGGGTQPTVDALTVVRLRGELLLSLVSAVNPLDGFRGAFGVGIVSLPAFTAGIASVPTPITEEGDENWLYHRYFTLFTGDGTEANFFGPSFARIEVDSKAMRMAGVDKVFYAAIEVVEVGSAVMDVSFNSRFLNKLP